MVVLDIQEIKCDASRSATTASSPRRQVQSEAVFLVVDGGAAEEKETLLQEEKIVSKREPSGRVKLKFLNGLRGLASLLIVHHHAGYLLEVTIAPSSVDIFFVLSSFLLTMINASKIQKLVAHKASFREWIVVLLDYFVKRLLRVYPLFACVAIVLTCMPEATRTHYYNLAHYNIQSWSLWDILTFKKRYYLFWTMPIEIAYYFMIPLFLVGHCYLDKAPKAKWSVIGLLYIWVYYEGCYTQRTTHGEFRPHLPTFLAGSLAAAVYLDLSKAMKKRTFEPSKWHLVAVRAFELTMLSTMISDVCRGLLVRWFNGSLFPSQHPAVPSVSLPISTVIVIEALAPSAISHVLEWNVLCFTGKISFSMYLLHPFVNFLPWLLDLPRVDQFIVRLVLVYSLSTVSFFLIERNCQELATAFGKRLAKRAGPA
ncbi:hypothetical protein PC129_g11607 [Phytophthora cactorum]|uniref:Acyltransferase 3 domain-containing protein n=1 Tax=Phytophthora cactorum TaxID=29920 RepID=A0A329S211_9STRA|nr:hypothetical protein Pcac1_g18294 [Phytophthora cactorum]KAG2820138.1 hypothetical protein PC111_g11596 [Phytophthora cactorum]KAG2844201.1 hypothetical protein PC112_g2279 [Phytophthora cactorum]KAG2854871.1 hypothetical protein PC113_g12927 [Phytophthora cactorum]KAG2899643.1 hypothetical protein PC114_g13857 [Phytophthora cactorum]